MNESFTMKTYLLIDVMNLMWRAAHVARGDAYTRQGLALHIMLQSIPYVAKNYSIDHVIFCFEGHSWRKDFDSTYKLNRKLIDDNLSADDREFKDYMLEILNDLKEFIDTKTHATVLQHHKLEADDLIAGWCQTHPDDTHIILQSDSDFKQLLAPNVIIHNGVEQSTTYHDKIILENGKMKKDKDGNIVIPENAEYFLFKKIIRGDTSDNIRPSYPGVREKGTKKKVGIIDAFNDRREKGYNWNSFMNEQWTDHEGVTHYVKDKFNHNKILIDLTAQPDYVKKYIAETIASAYNNDKRKQMIGIHFIKFCGKYELNNIATNASQISDILTKRLVQD